MVVLGLWDGPDAGAALVIDDRLVAAEQQERHDRRRHSGEFPWAAVEEVLEEAGLRARHVDVVALAGRVSPPLILRRRPGLKRAVKSAFSPLVDLTVFAQAVLRHTGLGAIEADWAAEWLEGRLRGAGFTPQRVTAVDLHRCLAEGAYRSQPRPDLTVLTLHPMGDGASVVVHVGNDGLLERTWTQKGFSALHVHLQRCMESMGLGRRVDHALLDALASRGRPDPAIVAELDRALHVIGPRLSRKNYPFPERRDAPVYQAIASAPVEVAAASIIENLSKVARDLARYHVGRTGQPHLAVAGSVFESARVCAAVADLDEVASLWVPPTPGFAGLASGAAAALAGIAPSAPTGPGLGRQYHERQHERALGIAGMSPIKPVDEAEAAAAFLADGQGVVRFRGRAGYGRHGGGTRSVLVRADDTAAIERVRAALNRPDDEPACLYLGSDASVTGALPAKAAERLGGALRYGHVALPVSAAFVAQYPGVVSADARVLPARVDPEDDAILARILSALQRRTGKGVVAAFPIALGSDPVVAVPGDAIRVWKSSGFPALLLGPFLVQRP